MSDHAKGLLLTGLGILIVSPDTLLIRLVGLDIWSLAVWRGGLQAFGLTLILLCWYRRRTFEMFQAIGTAGLVLALVFSVNTFTFLAAVQHTTVANTLVILAATPFFAALLSRIFLKEPVAARTWAAIAVALGGIALIVSDSLGSGSLYGDAMAILAAILLATKVTLIRGRRHINMIPALALSGVLIAAVAAPFGAPQQVAGAQLLWVLLMGLAVVTPATALITLGPRYLSAPEVSLLILFETVLGPLWVWLVLSETPTPLALVGGAVVIAALVGHAMLGLRTVRRPVPA